MSDEAMIRTALAAWNQGGFDAFAEFLAPDAEWHTPTQHPERIVWRGRDQIKQDWHAEFDPVFCDMRTEVVELSQPNGGPDWYLAVRATARSPISRTDLDWHLYYLITVEDGAATTVREFMDESVARAAALGGAS